MLIVPAIDLINNKCVRLHKGSYDEVTVYGDPVEMAQSFMDMGAKLIHVVDLEGADSGKNDQEEMIKKLAVVTKGQMEIGGGIRNIETMKKYLDFGIKRIILGTVACENKELLSKAVKEFGNSIVVGIDALGGIVKTRGWKIDSQIKAIDLVKEVNDLGVSRVIYTDINKDGAMLGPNLQETLEISQGRTLNVTVSGGMTDLNNLRDVLKVDKKVFHSEFGIDEVILGRSLYEGTINLGDALRMCEE